MHKLNISNTSIDELVVRLEPSGVHVFVAAGQTCQIQFHSSEEIEDCFALRYTKDDLVVDVFCEMSLYINGLLEYDL